MFESNAWNVFFIPQCKHLRGLIYWSTLYLPVLIVLLFVLQDSDGDDVLANVSFGTLTVIEDDGIPPGPNLLYLESVSTGIISEGSIVMDDLKTLPEAFCLLFGLSYALNLDYPKGMTNTFNFVQRVMFRLGQNRLTLKNLLLS